MLRISGAGLALILVVLWTSEGQGGAKDGARRWSRKLEKNADVSYKIVFEAGKNAEFAILGDGSTDVDIFVYDEAGKLVKDDQGLSDMGLARWIPAKTQTYTIKISNLDAAPNQVMMGHN